MLAGALWLGWSLTIDVDPRSRFHFDMTWYDVAALTFLDGRVLTDSQGEPTAFWPLVYPALLVAFGSTAWRVRDNQSM